MFLPMGKDTYKVSLQEVFSANRQRLVDRLVGVLLREEREEPDKLEVDIVPPNTSNNNSHNNNRHNNNNDRRRRRRRCIVYLQGGASETRNDSDHEPLFRQESYFWYLTGVKEPDCAAMIDIQIPSGLDDDISTYQTTLLIPELPDEYATVMGRIKKPMDWKDLYQVDHVRFTNETNLVLEEALFQTSKNTIVNSNGIDMNGNGSVKTSSSDGSSTPMLLLLQGNNSDSGKDYKAPPMEHFSTKIQKVINTDLLFHVLAEARVLKSAAELALLQHVTQVTSFAHAYVMRNMKVDMMEYQAESLFRHYCYYNYGCRLVSYTPICGCGPNAAILHYGHAGEPNARQIVHGDICLFDMGAEYYGYGSDVTCSFPISGQFSDLQRPIYQAVLNAQVAVYQMMKPGVSWVACHKAAEMEILKVLVDIGLVVIINDGGDHKRTLEELVEMRLCAVFMPHGLGHFIGIGTLLLFL
jgi:Xaa-Pro dipeptidase